MSIFANVGYPFTQSFYRIYLKNQYWPHNLTFYKKHLNRPLTNTWHLNWPLVKLWHLNRSVTKKNACFDMFPRNKKYWQILSSGFQPQNLEKPWFQSFFTHYLSILVINTTVSTCTVHANISIFRWFIEENIKSKK